MRAGRLRHNVTIERQSSVQDAYGQRVDTWSELTAKRAAIEPLSGDEYFTSKGENTEVEARIRVRYDRSIADLSPSDRVNHNGVIYDIISVINPSESGKEYLLMCKRNG